MKFIHQKPNIETIKDVVFILGAIFLLVIMLPIGLIKLFSIWFKPDVAMQLFIIVNTLIVAGIMSLVAETR